MTTSVRLLVPLLSACLCGPAAVQGQSYPIRPIRLVVGFAPGGGTDLVARIVARKMTDGLGQSVVVDNRPGAGGIIANEIVVRAAADGYTLNVTTSSYAVSSAVHKLSYEPLKDITPICLLGSSPLLFVTPLAVPVNNVKELIHHATALGGRLNYASTGQGGITHIGVELFKMMANVEMNHIPYKGTGPALTDLLRGEVQFMLGTNITTVPHIRGKRLRGLAVTTLRRSPVVPELPTVDESGVPGYELSIWYGIWGPARLPQSVLSSLHAETGRILALPDVRESLTHEGLEVASATPEEFRQIIRRDIEKFTNVARASRMKVH